VLLSALGWLDDRRGVSAAIRLAVQVLVSFALLALLSVGLVSLSWWSWLLYALALVGVMNAYNFMDGSNGMAGFQGAFAGLLLAGLYWQAAAPELAVPALLLAAACLGFLPVNFPLARVFMGDSGSVPLGFGLAALIGLGINQGVLSLPVGLMVLGVFLVDSSLTLLKRVFQGERWYTAHKQHVYQRLIAQGWPHSRVLLLYQAINMFLVAPVILLARMYPNLAWTLAGVVFLLLTTGWYLASLRLEVRN
jgi:Fuc2NAc and GlcNAc transferase